MKYYKAANQLIFLCCQKGGTIIKNTLDAKGGAVRNILSQEGRPSNNKIMNARPRKRYTYTHSVGNKYLKRKVFCFSCNKQIDNQISCC